MADELALIIPDFKVAIEEAEEKFRGFLHKDEATIRSIQELVIETDEQAEHAGAFLKIVRDSSKEEETDTKERAKPYDDAATAIRDISRVHRAYLKALDKTLAAAISKYHADKIKAAKQVELQLKKDAVGTGISPNQIKVAAPAKKTANVVGSITMKDHWKVIKVDMALLPEFYKMANMEALEKAGNESKGEIVIPGVEFEYAPIPATGK